MSTTTTLTPLGLLRRLFDALERALLDQLESAGLAAPVVAFLLRRFRRLADNFLYFTIHPDRCPPPRPAKPRPTRLAATPRISRQPFTPPKTHGWLCRLLPGGQLGGYAFQLERHLHTPDFIGLLTEHPDLGRHLHGLCRMLGIKRPRPNTTSHPAAWPASANPAPAAATNLTPEPILNSPAPVAAFQPLFAAYFKKP